MQHPLAKQQPSTSILKAENPRDYVPMHAIITQEINEKTSKDRDEKTYVSFDYSGIIWDRPIYAGVDGEIW